MPGIPRALACCNVDALIASVQGTLADKLELQEAVYDQLEELLDESSLRDVALQILRASSSTIAGDIIRRNSARPARNVA